MDKHDVINFELINSIFETTPVSILVDAGANMGIYTNLFLSKVNQDGKVFSIELDPDNYNHLKNNYKNCNNVVLINCAITNEVGSNLPYYKHKTHHEMSRLFVDDSEKNQYEFIGNMNTSTLDEILKEEQKIDILKIDIEGGEFYAIDGMVETLKKTDIIFYENHTIEAWKKVGKILIDNDYSIYNIELKQKIDNNSPTPYQTVCLKNIKLNELKNKNNNHWICK